MEVEAQKRITVLLEKTHRGRNGSLARKVADFRTAYVNVDRIQAESATPVQPMLRRIGEIRNKTALAQWLGRSLRADVDPLMWGVFSSPNLFGLAVDQGVHGEGVYLPYLLQGGLGLADPETYAGKGPAEKALRARYQEYIARTLSALGFKDAATRAESVMALETELSRHHLSAKDSDDLRNADHAWTLADFSSQAPGLDWPAFFAAAGLSKQKQILVWHPSAMKGAAASIQTSPLKVWKDYLSFHLIDQYSDVLPRAYAKPSIAFHESESAGQQSSSSREQRAQAATLKAMPEGVAQLYVEHYFPAAWKARLQSIVADVTEAFGKRIEAASWMTPIAKRTALSKLKRIYFGVGYPDAWRDHASLTIDPADALGNAMRISKWNYRFALSKLGKPVNRLEWCIPAHTVGAVLGPLQLTYNFPAGLLQAPKFDPDASDAFNYGAIGAIIGHELSHFFDPLGADFDEDSRPRTWWTDQDRRQFQTASQALVDQYTGYRIREKVAIDGKLTLSENTADLGGLAAAFDAHRKKLDSKNLNQADVHQQDRQFFIGFARSWRGKITDAELRKQVATDSHAPDCYRIATVRNIDAWYEAFDVQPGQRLYLEPKLRVRIW